MECADDAPDTRNLPYVSKEHGIIGAEPSEGHLHLSLTLRCLLRTLGGAARKRPPDGSAFAGMTLISLHAIASRSDRTAHSPPPHPAGPPTSPAPRYPGRPIYPPSDLRRCIPSRRHWVTRSA